MPNRILREGILTSSAVDRLSPGAEVLYRRLMSAADDHGRYWAEPSLLAAGCYPLRCSTVDHGDLRCWLQECVDAGLVDVYEVESRKYLEIRKFAQRVQSKSKFPPKSTVTDGDPRESTVVHGDPRLTRAPAMRAQSESESESESESTTTARAARRPPKPPSSSPTPAAWPETTRAIRSAWPLADDAIIGSICASAIAASRGHPLTDALLAAAVARAKRNSHRSAAALLAAVPTVIERHWQAVTSESRAAARASPQGERSRVAVVTREDGTVDWEATDRMGRSA